MKNVHVPDFAASEFKVPGFRRGMNHKQHKLLFRDWKDSQDQLHAQGVIPVRF